MNPAPDHTAVRVALWRALHVQIDRKPHVFVDEIGTKLVGEENWCQRPDMDPQFSKAMRASIAGRARFIEDLVKEQSERAVSQYVILGAGLDTFAQRRPEIASKMQTRFTAGTSLNGTMASGPEARKRSYSPKREGCQLLTQPTISPRVEEMS